MVTDIPNRNAFYERIGQEIKRMHRYKRPLTIAYLDCDKFKQINDQFGHHAGDKALRLIAASIKDSIRSVDMVARLGGDEFIILLPETNYNQAQPVLLRAREKIMANMQRQNWPMDLSVGAVTFMRPLESIDEMIKKADSLMYAAKNERENPIKHEICEK